MGLRRRGYSRRNSIDGGNRSFPTRGAAIFTRSIAEKRWFGSAHIRVNCEVFQVKDIGGEQFAVTHRDEASNTQLAVAAFRLQSYFNYPRWRS